MGTATTGYKALRAAIMTTVFQFRIGGIPLPSLPHKETEKQGIGYGDPSQHHGYGEYY
jgi:hypothetical protein